MVSERQVVRQVEVLKGILADEFPDGYILVAGLRLPGDAGGFLHVVSTFTEEDLPSILRQLADKYERKDYADDRT